VGRSKQLTFGSLFAGIGGFDLGFERAGMRCAWQVEIAEFPSRVLAKHWPNVRRWDDVRTFPPAGDWSVDVICGGDPCQENSAARTFGNVSQQSLGGEFIRVVDALRPRIVVRENPSHVRKDAPWPWRRIRSALESLGYAVLPFRLRACCIGAKHQRDRLFLLAELSDADRDGLEGRQAIHTRGVQSELPRLVDEYSWPDIPARVGYHSRNGLPGYVDMVKAAGNAVVPQVAEWIGRRIVEAAA
jgi:DNA (cytosine-5)-methyltransferase 1